MSWYAAAAVIEREAATAANQMKTGVLADDANMPPKVTSTIVSTPLCLSAFFSVSG